MERTVCHSDIQITSLLRVILINHDIMFRHTQSHHRSYSICIQEQRTYHNEQWFPRFTLLRIDISQALQQSLSTNESACCSILSPVSHTLHPSHTQIIGTPPLSLSHSSPSHPPPSHEINSPPLLLEIGKARPFLPKRHLPLPSLAEEPRRLRRLLLPHALRGWKAVSVNGSREHSIAFDSRTLGVINAFPPKR